MSIFASMMSCVWLALVRAEKVMKIGTTSAGISVISLLLTWGGPEGE